MKKIIALAACALLFAGTASSQNYKNAIGVRIGAENSGLTYKHQLNKGNAVEVMVWLGYDSGAAASGIYEWTTPVINKDFNLYYGAGGHLGVFSNHFNIGVDGIVGLEYKLPKAPIAFSIDYKPSLNFTPGYGNGVTFGYYNFGLGIKYTF